MTKKIDKDRTNKNKFKILYYRFRQQRKSEVKIKRAALIIKDPNLNLSNIDVRQNRFREKTTVAITRAATQKTVLHSFDNNNAYHQYPGVGAPIDEVVQTSPKKGVTPTVIRTQGVLQYARQNVTAAFTPVEKENTTPNQFSIVFYTPTKPKLSEQMQNEIKENSAEPDSPTVFKSTSSDIDSDDVELRRGVKRPCSQKQVMGMSARDAVKNFLVRINEQNHDEKLCASLGIELEKFKAINDKIKKEWCHGQAFSLNGPQSKKNLNAGSSNFNSDMMPYETVIYNHASSDNTMHLNTIAEVYEETDILKSFTYQFRDSRIREIAGQRYYLEFSVHWNGVDEIWSLNKPSQAGFDTCVQLFDKILSGIEEPQQVKLKKCF